MTVYCFWQKLLSGGGFYTVENIAKLECGPMPNVMVTLPNIGGAVQASLPPYESIPGKWILVMAWTCALLWISQTVFVSGFSTSHKIVWEERLQSNLFCVNWDMKPLNQTQTLFETWPTWTTTHIKGWLNKNKKASIRWQDSSPPVSGYWPTSEPNAG